MTVPNAVLLAVGSLAIGVMGMGTFGLLAFAGRSTHPNRGRVRESPPETGGVE